jgi:hypothetical protein
LCPKESSTAGFAEQANHRAVVSAPLDCFGSGAAGIKAERDSELDADEISLGRLVRRVLDLGLLSVLFQVRDIFGVD